MLTQLSVIATLVTIFSFLSPALAKLILSLAFKTELSEVSSKDERFFV